MFPQQLVYKKALRIGPVKYPITSVNGEPNKVFFDWSYTDEPVIIMSVTNTHVLVKEIETKEVRILDSKFIDDDWLDYSELSLLVDKQLKYIKGMDIFKPEITY